MDAKITIFYVVGGDQCHYDNLDRSIRSLKERMKIAYKVSVLEIGNKLISHDNVRVFNMPELINLNSGGKVGFKFWQQKYKITEFIDTEYGMYLDTDTVLVYDSIETILPIIGEKFGVVKHFWVPTFWRYLLRAVPRKNIFQFLKLKKTLKIRLGDNFFAGGVFIFKNTESNKNLLKEVSKVYDSIYPESSSYVRGITDEVFFSAILASNNKFEILNGALNHCCMGDGFMPLIIRDGGLFGKNPFDRAYEKVTFFHCDIQRRNPAEKYAGDLKERIKSAWYI